VQWRTSGDFHLEWYVFCALEAVAFRDLAFWLLWLAGTPRNVIETITGHGNATITAYTKYFGQLLASDLEEESCVIGGRGIVVEADETKMGKRKYHRGHRVEGVWVVVGIERAIERKMFAFEVEDCSETTLKYIIDNFVKDGSTVCTDGWRRYTFLSRQDRVTHETVNHSQTFMDPVTGTHTNTVEGTNSGLKRAVSVRNRAEKDIGDLLSKFIWKRQRADTLWDSFIGTLGKIQYTD
jgi:IS1 family transposase